MSLGDVFRAVDGPLAEVRGLRPHETSYEGVARHLPTVWVAVRVALREVLDETSLADVLDGDLPPAVRAKADAPDAWRTADLRRPDAGGGGPTTAVVRGRGRTLAVWTAVPVRSEHLVPAGPDAYTGASGTPSEKCSVSPCSPDEVE